MVSEKGKEKVTDASRKGKGKRKNAAGDGDGKTGRKRKNPGVVQFFEEEAYDVDEEEDYSDGSLFDGLEDLEQEFSVNFGVDYEPAGVPNLPFIKEEDIGEEELDRMLEERYKPGSGFVTYMEDGHDHKKSIDRNIYVPSAQDPIIWKVKCGIGRERFSAFCLMQKFADVVYLGNKMQIISACAVEHVKGFIFIEAEKREDIYEACKGLASIYSSRVEAVPNKELSRVLSVRSKSSGISKGMWARVKNGVYKGDLAQVVAVNHDRKKITVKLVPRIDLKALAEKIGGGVTGRRTTIPAQRLISSSELEEFRPLIQTRRDRETNQMFEILNGMVLKDGYLYKKISIDSLSFWGVMPTEGELLKFEPSRKEESTDVQWLSQLFGEKEKKEKEVEIVKDKGGGKSEGSFSACMGSNFEMHDLVFFGRKDFGVVIGSEKDGSVKVLKEGSEGLSVVTVKRTDIKSASFDKKLFSVLDQHSNTLSVNDNVRVLEGPLKDRQGIVKKIYRGVLFLFDETQQENNGYICVKAQLCEKINVSVDASKEKGSESGPSDFADIPSAFADMPSPPKSPSPSEKSWQERVNTNNFKRDDNEMFSVGQSVRIRVGPLKGYRCRVLALRRSDVTVKLDSQQKILTVKSENLSEVRAKNSAVSQGDGSGSIKPFGFLGTEDGARDWVDGAVATTDGDNWNAGGSTERSSWSALPSSDILVPKGSGDNGGTEGAEDSSWQTKASPDQNSSWGASAFDSKAVTETGSLDGWGKPVQPETIKDDSWGAASKKQSPEDVVWGQPKAASGPETSAWKKDSDAMDKSKESTWESKVNTDMDASSGGWGTSKDTSGEKANEDGWGKSAEKGNEDASGKTEGMSSWNNGKGESSWGNSVGKSSCGQKADVNESGGDGGYGGWKSGGMGDSKPFDGGRGGGRRGRGMGRGGRGQLGRGSSFEQGKSTSWNNNSSSSDQGGGWGKENVSDKDKMSIDGETGNGWGSASQNKDSNDGNTSGWGGSFKANEDDSNKSSWKTETASLDENWDGQKASEETGGGWNLSNSGQNESGSSWKGNGGSAGEWGQSSWLKNEGNAGGGSQDSTWNSKSDWNSDNQDNNGGRGWRGGRGGRGDRGGFRGRGDRGGFRGRGGSDRGGFGGRSGGRGGFGGREGFGGRGGFRGRGGRGDWNNRGDGSNNDGEGWKSGGNNNLSQSGGWKNGGGGSSWGEPKGDSSDMVQSKEYGQGEGVGNDGWGKAGSSSWGAATTTGDGSSSGGWKKTEGGTDVGGQSKDEGPSDGWGKAAGW